MQFQVLAKFPEIDRQIILECRPNNNIDFKNHGPDMGCHVLWLAGMYLRIFDWKTLKDMKGVDIPIEKTQWGPTVGATERQKVIEALGKWTISDADRKGIYDKVISGYTREGSNAPSGPTFVLMSDNVNSHTPEFPKHSGIPQADAAPHFKTYHFVQYLCKNRIGFVMGSPIGRNQYHQSNANFSLTQAYIWIPPNFVKYACPASWFMSGRDQLPSWEKWYEDVGKRLHLKEEEINPRLFKQDGPEIKRALQRRSIKTSLFSGK